METKPYHHGDLRRQLIETGIQLIGTEGEEKLSLRKVAAQCGVSNAAPYAHFENKDAFIGAIQQHIMDQFTAALEEAVQTYGGSPAVLPELGKAYVLFFYRNPFYYDFLFSRKHLKITLSLDQTDNPEIFPLAILKKAAVPIFAKAHIPRSVIQDKIIAMWALVQGLSAISIMPNVVYDEHWESKIQDIIQSITILYESEENEP